MGRTDSTAFNVYCDESCHLENDGKPYMVLGSVWHPEAKTREIADRLRDLKAAHGLPPGFELKWGQVTAKKIGYYLAVLDYFFDDDDLHFRALVAEKQGLDHSSFGQDHDTWYYKMYYQLLRWIFRVPHSYRVYIDQKDTRGGTKVANLRKHLQRDKGDFTGQMIRGIEIVQSRHVQQVQLADFLTGAVSYATRGLESSSGKTQVAQRLATRAGQKLTGMSLLDQQKVNIFQWRPQVHSE